MSSTDRIEKRVVLRAPIERVWRAISDTQAFGAWFGVAFEGPFVEGKETKGKIVPTQVDPHVAEQQKSFSGMPCDVFVVQIEPMRRLSFRWNPGVPEPGVDLATEPQTVVTFSMEEVPEGTALTITESGFDVFPAERRAKVFAQNAEGWAIQATLIEKYLDGAR